MTKYSINFVKEKKKKQNAEMKRKRQPSTTTTTTFSTSKINNEPPKKKIKKSLHEKNTIRKATTTTTGKKRKKKSRKTNQGNFVCYALFSKCRRKTYIGKTNDLLRRLRQHNGEIGGGARATRGMQHEHLFFVSGFQNERQALKFEWRMHHPGGYPRSRRPSGIDGCFKTLFKVCRLERWTKSSPLAKKVPLTVHYRNHFKDFILKYEKKFPKHIKHEYYFTE